MKLAICGLGKMGMNLALNLMEHGHEIVAFDLDKNLVKEAASHGAIPASSLEDVASKFDEKRIIWMMVPAGDATESVFTQISPYLTADDIIIDGGNANYKDTIRRYETSLESGINYIDVGTSGGTEGARHGACTMVGGDEDIVKEVEQIFVDVSIENGYLYTGKSGSGHFVKMIHNGIEYGMMQAMGEGFDILEASPYDFNYEEIARVWNHGSVIRSWLMELMQDAFAADPNLDEIKGIVHASGEGKWTVETALEYEVAAPVIAMSLMARNRSLKTDTFSGKVVASLRNQFGGHAVVSND